MKWRYIQHLWASLADVHEVLGDATRALDYANRCLADAERTTSKRYIVRGREGRARAMAALGSTAEAIDEASAATAVADGIGSPTQRWRSRLVLGDVLRGVGRSAEASVVFAKGFGILDTAASSLTSSELRDRLLGSEEAVRLQNGAR